MPSFSQQPIEMVRGKTRKFRFTVSDIATGLPVDITGWPAFWFLAKVDITDSDAAAVITKTLGSGITTISPTVGLNEVLILAVDTVTLADARATFWAEIQGRDAGGLPWSLWQGTLVIEPNLIIAN